MLAYLGETPARRLLAQMRTAAANGSTLALSLSLTTQSDLAQAGRQQLNQAVSALGEPLTLAVPRRGLGPFLADAGWRVQQATDPSGLDVAISERASAFVTAVASSSTAADT